MSRLLSLTCVLLGLVAAPVVAQPLSVDCHGDVDSWNQELLSHYHAIGIEAKCLYLPRARGAALVAGGELDATALRGEDFGQQFPHLIRVEPPLKAVPLMIFRRIGTDVTIDNWRSRSIATLRGAVIFDHLLAGLDVTRLATIEAAIKQLSAGRVDLMVGDNQLVPQLLQTMAVDNVEMLTPPVTTVLLYHYVQVKHRDLAARLSERLLATQN